MFQKPTLSTFPLENNKMEAIQDTPDVLAYLWREIGTYPKVEKSEKSYSDPKIDAQVQFSN